MSRTHQDSADIFKGIGAGLVAGLVGTWVMTRFQSSWSEVYSAFDSTEKVTHTKENVTSNDDAATINAANLVYRTLTGRELTDGQRPVAGQITHFAFGMIMGAAYSAAREIEPKLSAGNGSAFGAALWAAGDEFAVPLLGLSKPLQAYPLHTHLFSFAAHIVYGVTTEIVRRGCRSGSRRV